MTAEHVRINRAVWDECAEEYFDSGRRHWGLDEPTWGIFNVPDADVGMLPDVAGRDVVELGCGTGYVSAWIARRGGRPVGIDNSKRQLANARLFQDEFGLRFPLVHGDAEQLPFPDESFDVAVSEYGAVIWCDPYRWVPEAARVLRPGGELSFLGNGIVLMLCMPDEGAADERMVRPYFGMHRFTWPGEPNVEFGLGFGDWVRLFRRCGFDVEDYIEIQAPAGATTRYEFVTPEWARQWPAEHVWRVRKR